jgi:hypothetical protein
MAWWAVIWWPIKAICWPITPFLLKCCPNFHQHHRSNHPAAASSLSLSSRSPSRHQRLSRSSHRPAARIASLNAQSAAHTPAGALLLPEPSLSRCRHAPSPPLPQQQGESRPPLHGDPPSPSARAETGDD